MKNLYILIGVPASGKSTFREKLPFEYTAISSDDVIQRYADEAGKTYDEVYEDRIKTATFETRRTFETAIKRGDQHIVIDRTNLTPKSRKGWIAAARSAGYQVWAVVFRPPATSDQHAEWKHRLRSRPGKTIPSSVLDTMLQSFTLPTASEGFTKVVHENTW